MKFRTKVLFILLASLFVFTTASAYTGVIGTIQDAYGDPWGYDFTITAYNQDPPYEEYINPTTQFDETIDESWDIIPPPSAHHITVVITFDDCFPDCTSIPNPIVVSFPSNAKQAPYDLGTMSTGTGPNAIVLSNLTATSAAANPWLAAFIVVGALALVSGGVVVVRKKRK
jgi:LPXTG-motif cell wall-anchored protein